MNGNLSIQAGNNLHVTGSDLIAAQNITGTGANVVIDAATDTASRSQTQTSHTSGLSIGLSGSVGDAINNAYSQGQAVSHSANSGNDRAAALHAIAAAGNAAMTVAGVTGGALMKNPSIGVQVSIGSSSSRSDSGESQTTNRGSNVTAGGTTAFVATGDGTPGSGKLTATLTFCKCAATNLQTPVSFTRSKHTPHAPSTAPSFGAAHLGPFLG
ncbi:hemagglutinin repeat-containing protein [Paraburkholderia sp. IMGN_8]|uniref:hemagglutinin repeat-containing protein n=1 Tax=Paraburkholderia sp. IMGN_8 TaxID=3136564 RepID=UPI0031019317